MLLAVPNFGLQQGSVLVCIPTLHEAQWKLLVCLLAWMLDTRLPVQCSSARHGRFGITAMTVTDTYDLCHCYCWHRHTVVLLAV